MQITAHLTAPSRFNCFHNLAILRLQARLRVIPPSPVKTVWINDDCEICGRQLSRPIWRRESAMDRRDEHRRIRRAESRLQEIERELHRANERIQTQDQQILDLVVLNEGLRRERDEWHRIAHDLKNEVMAARRAS